MVNIHSVQNVIYSYTYKQNYSEETHEQSEICSPVIFTYYPINYYNPQALALPPDFLITYIFNLFAVLASRGEFVTYNFLDRNTYPHTQRYPYLIPKRNAC